MKINWIKYEDDGHVLSWFLTEAMSLVNIKKFGDNFDSSALDVVLTVNGIEVPIVEPMEFLNKQLSDIRGNAYKEGVKRAMEDMVSDIYDDIHEIIDRHMRQI